MLSYSNRLEFTELTSFPLKKKKKKRKKRAHCRVLIYKYSTMFTFLTSLNPNRKYVSLLLFYRKGRLRKIN